MLEGHDNMSSGDSDIFPVPNVEDIPMHSTPIKEGPLPGLRYNKYNAHRPLTQIPSRGNVTNSSSRPHSPSVLVRHNYSIHQEDNYTQAAKAVTLLSSPRSSPKSAKKQTYPSDLENSILLKQRQEIQLLICELKERDRELNDMVTSHHQQLLAWDQDRHRLLILEQKVARYENELTTRTKQLRKTLSEFKAVKSQHRSQNSTLETTQERLVRLSMENNQQTTLLHDLEEKNKRLNTSFKEMSTRIGQFEAKEEELTTMLKLRENDVIDAAGQIRELNESLKKFDLRCRESREREVFAAREAKHMEEKYCQTKSELDLITEQLQKKTAELETGLGEMERVRQHLSFIQQETDNQETAKDQLMTSLRAKQSRTEEQLHSLRELYERQQRELSLLQLNLEVSQEIVVKQQASLEENSSLKSSGCSRLMSQLSPNQSLDNPYTQSTNHTAIDTAYQNFGNKQSPNSLAANVVSPFLVGTPLSGNDENEIRLSSNNSDSIGEIRESVSQIQNPKQLLSQETGLFLESKTGKIKDRQHHLNSSDMDVRENHREHEKLLFVFEGVKSFAEKSVPCKTESHQSSKMCHIPDSRRNGNSDQYDRDGLPSSVTARNKSTDEIFPSRSLVHSPSPPSNDVMKDHDNSMISNKNENMQHHTSLGGKVCFGNTTEQFTVMSKNKVIDEEIETKQNGFCTPPRHSFESEVGESEHSKQYQVGFEECLTVFLDDVLDEAKTEENVSCSFGREMEASPASKLQKLLMESRLMIENLEKTASSSSSIIEEKDSGR